MSTTKLLIERAVRCEEYYDLKSSSKKSRVIISE